MMFTASRFAAIRSLRQGRSVPLVFMSAFFAALCSCTTDIETLVRDAVNRELEGRQLPGPSGEPGPAGPACWDTNGNGSADADEDANGDGRVDTLDCRGNPGESGAEGEAGAAGQPGVPGPPGPAGDSCWDLNGNGVGDVGSEDRNHDGAVNILDCQGMDGQQGSAGQPGEPGTPGQLPTGTVIITTSESPPEGFAYTGLSFSQGGGWTQLPTMPQALLSPAAAAVDGRVYMFGGLRYGLDNGFVNSVYELDVAKATWTEMAPMPTARAEAVAVALDGLIYVIGGTLGDSGPCDAVERFDPQQNTWETLSTLGTRRDYPGSAVVGGLIYVFGGWDGAAESRTLEVYDPDSDSWTPRAPMATRRFAPGAVQLNGMIYAIGGYSGATDERSVEIYDPSADSWSARAPLHQPREGMGAMTANGRIYAVGGFSDNGGIIRILDASEEYDPQGDLWQPTTFAKSPRGWLACAAEGSQMFILGGIDRFPAPRYLDTAGIFDPPTVFFIHQKL